MYFDNMQNVIRHGMLFGRHQVMSDCVYSAIVRTPWKPTSVLFMTGDTFQRSG